ncbi:MAG: hypothetical protein AB7O80_17320 [Acetobacteraceae bacterium]
MDSRTLACLDLAAVVLTIIGAWVLTTVGIPELVIPLMTDVDGAHFTDGTGVILAYPPDPISEAARARYMSYAIPATMLITFGQVLQAVRHIVIIIGRDE